MEKDVLMVGEAKNLPAYFSEYLALAMRTAKNFGTKQMDLIHGALGIGSEMGELHEVIVSAWLQIPTDINGISEEIGVSSPKRVRLIFPVWTKLILSSQRGTWR